MDLLLIKLEELNDVVLKLKLLLCAVRQTSPYFDSVLHVFLTVEAWLNQSARIVYSPLFESAVVKIQDATEQDFTRSEKRAVCGLLLEQKAAPGKDPPSDSIVERDMKPLKASVTTTNFKYQDTCYVLSTSDICERMLSIAGHAQTNHHQGILPHNSESQLFLYVNQSCCDIEDIKTIVHDKGKYLKREATLDMQWSDNRTHDRRSQAYTAARIL